MVPVFLSAFHVDLIFQKRELFFFSLALNLVCPQFSDACVWLTEIFCSFLIKCNLYKEKIYCWIVRGPMDP